MIVAPLVAGVGSGFKVGLLSSPWSFVVAVLSSL